MRICKTSPQTFIHLRKVFLLPRFNIDIQAVIWLPCKHTYTHEHSHKYTNTHPWTTSQKHRSHASESPLNKPGQWNQPWEKTYGLFTAAIAWEHIHRVIISKMLLSDGYIDVQPFQSQISCLGPVHYVSHFKLQLHLTSLNLPSSEMQVANDYCW